MRGGPGALMPANETLFYMILTGMKTQGSTWRSLLRQVEHLPALLHAIVALDDWNELSVLQHAP